MGFLENVLKRNCLFTEYFLSIQSEGVFCLVPSLYRYIVFIVNFIFRVVAQQEDKKNEIEII